MEDDQTPHPGDAYLVSVASLFVQVLSLISRREFSKAVRRRNAEKAAKGFSCWDQFVGTSENAVKVQIWTALISMLLLKLKLMQLRSSFGWSLSNLAAMLRMNLLTYRDLWKWLDEPYGYPASEPLEYALPLFANIPDSKTGGT